ncbi:hypothetical protein DJ62_3854 [Yersinia enterocolitica]|nr:hypothetical protein DJ62_3854 [Yersinia enterocolitica]
MPVHRPPHWNGTGSQFFDPVSQPARIILQTQHKYPGTLHQQSAQIFVSPLADPISVAFPPVLYCRGTSPMEAAKSRLLANGLPSPISDASRLAVIAPIAGIESRFWPTLSAANFYAGQPWASFLG